MTTRRDEDEAEEARIRTWLRLGDRVLGKKSVREEPPRAEPREPELERLPEQR